MAATVISASGATSTVFGCTAETGILIQSFSRNVKREKSEVVDNDGDIVAVSYYKPTASITIDGVINGTTGVLAAAPGVVLSVASTTSGSGITGGGIYVNSTTRSETAEGFATFSVDATQYPLIS
jgi:hypothetical protein